MVLYSNPGNPTGFVYTREELQMLGEIAKVLKLITIDN